MPKSKRNKKRKNKVLAYSDNIKSRQRKIQREFIKQLQESHTKEMESKVEDNTKTETDSNVIDDFNEFSLDTDTIESTTNTNDLNEFSMDDLPQVEQTAPIEGVSGSYSSPDKDL